MSLQTGTKVGAYEILSLIGKGGMGEVYLARDPRLDREVAIKILSESLLQDPQALIRFEQEAKTLASLSHPNILTVHDVVTGQNGLFIVMELLKGETLRDRLKRTKLEWQDAVQIGIEIAQGMVAAHSRGIIHRDLKPENVFLTENGLVKILDFGLVRIERKSFSTGESWMDTSPALSQPGLLLGTLRSMAPEQLRGNVVDTRADIYSFGCILYEMLSGHFPFQGTDPAEMTASILRDKPEEIAVPAPKELIDLTFQCLEKDPSLRVQSAEEILAIFRGIPSTHGATAPVPVIQKKARGKSVAILPIAHDNDDPENEYLMDGITESIINSLSQLPKLKVTARSTAFRYKGKEIDPRRVGRDLGVKMLMTGRGFKRGDRLEIQVELVNAEDGSQVWGEHFSKNLSDVFSVQEEIAMLISTALKPKLTGAEKKMLGKRYTQNVEAYQLYVKGRYYWNRRTAESFEKAITFFENAIELDPTYALAYTGIADCYNLLGWEAYGVMHPKIAFPRAIAAATKALEIDDKLAEGYNSLAWAKWAFNRDWDGAEEDYKRAIQLNHGYALTHVWYADLLGGCGRFEEALAEIQIAQTLDPLAPIIYSVHALILYWTRDYPKSRAQADTAIELQAEFLPGPFLKSHILVMEGKYEESMRIVEKLPKTHPRIQAGLALSYAATGRKEDAKNILDELYEFSKTHYQPALMEGALVYSYLGEIDTAFEWLEKAYAENAAFLVWLYPDPLADPLRSDPRFNDLMKRIGLPRTDHR